MNNQQYFRRKLSIKGNTDVPLIPKIMSTRNEQIILQETNRKKYINQYSPRRLQLPQINQRNQTPGKYRERVKSLNHQNQQQSQYLGPNDFLRLLQSDLQLGEEFCYLNNKGNPYEWQIVKFHQRNQNNYMTVSARGIIIHNQDNEEFMTIKQFETERKVFYRLQEINFFKTYLVSKTFSIWHKFVTKKEEQKIQHELVDNYLRLDLSLKKPLDEVMKYIVKLQTLRFLDSKINTMTAQKFHQKFLRNLNEFKKELNIQIQLIMKIVVDACQYSWDIFKQEQGVKQNLEIARNQYLETKPLIIGDNSTQSMPFTMEANLRAFQQKLKKFIKMVDYLQFEAMLSLIQSSIKHFIKIIQHANQVTKNTTFFSWIIVDIILNKGIIICEPNQQKLYDIFISIIEKCIQIIEECIPFGKLRQQLSIYGLNYEDSDLCDDFKQYGKQCLNNINYQDIIKQELDFSYKQINNYLGKINFNQNWLFGECNAEIIKEQFQQIANLQSEVDSLENVVDIGLVRLNVLQLKQGTSIYLKEIIKQLNQRLEDSIIQDCKILNETINNYLEKLKLKPAMLKQYVQYQENYQLIKSNQEQIDNQIEEIHYYNRIYNQADQSIPQNIKEIFEKIINQYQLFQYKFYDHQNQYNMIQEKFEKDFRRLTPIFNQKVLQFCEQFENNKDIDNIIFIQSINGQLIQLEKEYIELQEYSIALQIEKYINESLIEIREKYHNFKQLQLEIYDLKEKQNEWMREHFLDLNIPSILNIFEIVIQNCRNQSQQLLQKTLKYQKQLYEVIQILTQLKQFDQNIVTQVCKKDKTQDKMLLQLIMQISNNPLHPTFTTKYLKQFNIIDKTEALQILITQITYESQIMNQLVKLEEFWKGNKLIVQKIKNTKDQYNLVNLIQLNELLDENILIINNILGLPNIDDIKNRIDIQFKSIIYLQEYLQQLKQLQEMIFYLSGIFQSQMNQKNQGRELKMFQQQEKQWKQLLRLIQQQKSLEIWIKDESEKKYIKLIIQDNQNCLDIITSLTEQYQRKKYIFPRFYFMNEQQYNKMIIDIKNPAAMQIYLKDFFSNIYQFDYEPIKETVTALYSAQNDQLIVKYCPMKGEVEDWFKTVEEAMKQGLRQLIKSVSKHGENYSILRDYPIQILYICMKITLTLILEDMLSNEERDWNELLEYKNYELQDQIKQLKEEQVSLKQHFHQISIITILMNQINIIKELQEFNVHSDKDYLYAKQYKYYLDDDEIYCQQLEMKVQYGYEFFADDFHYLHFSQGDRTILKITSMNKIFPMLYGNQTQYITTQYAHLLGKYYRLFQVDISTDYSNVLSQIFGAVSSNSLLMISNFEQIEFKNQLHLIQIFSQIINLAQIQDLDGKNIKVQSNFFLTILNSKISIPYFKQIDIFQPEIMILWYDLLKIVFQEEKAQQIFEILKTLKITFGNNFLDLKKLQKFNNLLRSMKSISINDIFDNLKFELNDKDKQIFEILVESYYQNNNNNNNNNQIDQLIQLLNEDNLILIYGNNQSGKTTFITEMLNKKKIESIIIELDSLDNDDIINILNNINQQYFIHFIMHQKQEIIKYQQKEIIFQNILSLQNSNIIFESSNISHQDPSIIKNFVLYYYNIDIPLQSIVIKQLQTFIINIDLQHNLAKCITKLIENYYLQEFNISLHILVRSAAQILSVYYDEQQFKQFTQFDVENISYYTVYICFCLLLSENIKQKICSQIKNIIIERKLDQLFNQKYQSPYLNNYFNEQELYCIIHLQQNILLYGGMCCNKSTIAKLKTQGMFNLQSYVCSTHLQDFLDRRLMSYKKDKQLFLSPPFGQIKQFAIEDINLSSQCRYFIKCLIQQGYMFDKKNNYQQKYLNSVYFIATSQDSNLKSNLFQFLPIECNRKPITNNIYSQIYSKAPFDIDKEIIILNNKCQNRWKCTPKIPFIFNHNIWNRIINQLPTDPNEFLTEFHNRTMRIIGGFLNIEETNQLDKFIKEINIDQGCILEIKQFNQEYQILLKLAEQQSQKLFLHESHLQKILQIVHGWKYDQHVVIIGQIGSGRNSFAKLAKLFSEYNDIIFTNLTEDAYSQLELASNIHLCVIIQQMNELTKFPRFLYRSQLIQLFEWPKIFYQEVATKIITEKSIDINIFYKIFSKSQGYIRQFIDSLNIFESQFQKSKAENTRLIIIYSKVLNKIEDANQEFHNIDENLNNFINQKEEITNQINNLNIDVSKEKQETADFQQQIVRLSENISKCEIKVSKQFSQLHQLFNQFQKKKIEIKEIIIDFDNFDIFNINQLKLGQKLDFLNLEEWQIEKIQNQYPEQQEQLLQIYQNCQNVSNYQNILIQTQQTLQNDKITLEEMRKKFDLSNIKVQQLEKQIEILQSKQRMIIQEIEKLDQIHSQCSKCLKYLNIYQLQWQQHIFALQQQQTNLLDINIIQIICQCYNQQFTQKEIELLNLQGKLEHDNMHLLLGLKYLDDQMILIIDNELIAQDYICQYYPTAIIINFDESEIDNIQTQNNQCIIITDVIINELINNQKWRSFIQQQIKGKIFFLSYQIKQQYQTNSFIRTIYFKKSDREIESFILLQILNQENPDLFDQLTTLFDEENPFLINLGSLLDEDKPLIESQYEEQLSLLISSQFGSIINLDILNQILEIIQKWEDIKFNYSQYNFQPHHPLIIRFLVIYRSLQLLHQLDRRYYIGLEELSYQLIKIIAQVQNDTNERYWMISNHFTYDIMLLIEQMLKQEHHLLAKFLIFVQIDLRNRTILQDQYYYITGCQIQKDLSKFPKQSPAPFIQWDDVKYIMALSPMFEDLHQQITKQPKEWMKWLDDQIPFPKEYDEKLQIFEKLLLIKAFKPKWLRRYINEYVQDRLLRIQSKQFKELNNKTKIIYIDGDLQTEIQKIQSIKMDKPITLYQPNQIIDKPFIFYKVSHQNIDLQDEILQSKYTHIIFEILNEDLLQDKTILKCPKFIQQYKCSIKDNMKSNFPKQNYQNGDIAKAIYSLSYMHYFLIYRKMHFGSTQINYDTNELQQVMHYLYFIPQNLKNYYLIAYELIYNIEINNENIISTLISKHISESILNENYSFLNFQTLPIGSEIWIDEMINRIPDSEDTYTAGFGINNQILYNIQNDKLIQQLNNIVGIQNIKQKNQTQFKLLDPLKLIQIEQKLTRKNSFHKNDQKPFSQYYKKLILKKQVGTPYIDAIDQFINIQIEKYNNLISIINKFITKNLINNDTQFFPEKLIQYLWFSPKSMIPIIQLINLLNSNLNILKTLRDQQNRKYFDLSILYNPSLLFEFFKLQFSRKTEFLPYELHIYSDISKYSEISHIHSFQLNDGTYLIGGFECYNCQWNFEKHKLVDVGHFPTQNIPFLIVSTLINEQQRNLKIPIMNEKCQLFTLDLQSDLDQETINIREAKIIVKH